MKVLLDTNLLGRYSQPHHAFHPPTLRALRFLGMSGHELCIVPQIIYEYWAVATRPQDRNGLGFSTETTGAWVETFIRLFTFLRDERRIFEPWNELVRVYRCHGRAVHDARIVAAMKRHGIRQLMTFDVNDFARFSEIEIVDPMSLGPAIDKQ
jgi:predicted nucleic acid-binding protein